MFSTYTRPSYQLSVYRTIGPLLFCCCFAVLFWLSFAPWGQDFLLSSAMGFGQTRYTFIVRHWVVRVLSFVFHLH